MRGIIFAGGDSLRLWPVTTAIPKYLLPVCDKPMIYYPLSLLLLARIRHILVISTPRDMPRFQRLLGGGERWGISLGYALQSPLDGPARAFVIGSEFIGNHPVALVLADNIFYGRRLESSLKNAATLKKGARVFACPADARERHEVVSFDKNGNAGGLGEKPVNPESRPEFRPESCPESGHAVTGLSFYDNTVVERARALKPSEHNRIEITDLNQTYLDEGNLELEVLDSGITWLEIDAPDSLLSAAGLIKAAEKLERAKIGCPEEIAWRMGFIGDEQLLELAATAGENQYGRYLRQLPER